MRKLIKHIKGVSPIKILGKLAYRRWWSLFCVILLFSVAIIHTNFRLIRVHGSSMNPTYVDGETLIVQRTKTPQVGDVVVVRYKDHKIIKRLIRFENQEIYILGDNLNGSTDSRTFGTLPLKEVEGVVVYSLSKEEGETNA